MIALALKSLGLMRVSEHERIVDERDNDAYASWNRAITERDDMAASRADMMHNIAKMQVENRRLADGWDKCGAELNAAKLRTTTAVKEASRLQGIVDTQGLTIAGYREQVADLTPDAQKWRDYLKRSRDRKAGKK